jgi:hypothetical protein
MPVTTMEEVPMLTPQERAELLTSIAEAEAEIVSGRSKTFEDSAEFRTFLAQGMKTARAKSSGA